MSEEVLSFFVYTICTLIEDILMAKTYFPAGFSIDFQHINMEEMEYYARAWNLQRIQMEKGSFVGSMIATHTKHMQVMKSPYSHGVLLQGEFPKGTILIASVVTKADVSFQNSVANPHEIKILRSGDEIDFLCNSSSETFTIAVEEHFFKEAYIAYFQEEFSDTNKNKIYIHPEYLENFSKGIDQWIGYLLKAKNLSSLAYTKIEYQILSHVFSSIYREENSKSRQKFSVSKAKDLLHASIHEPSHIMHLAGKLGISERSLHHSFKKNYGISPKQYLMYLRMHSIKQELLLASAYETQISTIIEKYAFFNHSTFTQAYKNMFGELPSHTLQKSP